MYILVNSFLFCSLLTKTIFLVLGYDCIPMCNNNHTYLQLTRFKFQSELFMSCYCLTHLGW